MLQNKILQKESQAHGFSLASLIISLAVFLVLSAVLLVALDPAGRINKAKDARRTQDVVVIAQALKDYVRHHQGELPFANEISNRKRVLCSSLSRLTCGADADACLKIDTTTDFFSSYLPTLPVDPDKTGTADTGYYIEGDPATGQITVGSCSHSGEEIVYNPSIQAEVLNCGTAGIAYNGKCWYSVSSSATNVNCAYVCGAGFGLTCDNGVIPTANGCELNRLFGTHTCTSCTDTTPYGDYAYSPGVANSGVANCTEDRDTNICGGTLGVNYRPICPCY